MVHVSNGSCSTKATYYVTCDKSQSVVPNLSIKSFTSSCTFIWYRADLSSCTRFGSAASDGSVRTASSHWFSPSAEYQANGSTYIPRHRYRLRFASWLWITVLVLWLNYYMNETIFDFTYSGGLLIRYGWSSPSYSSWTICFRFPVHWDFDFALSLYGASILSV